MHNLDKAAKKTLKDIYMQFESASEITVKSPEFKKTIVDYLIDKGLIEKWDVSTLTGWEYVVMPTHYGELAFEEILNTPLSKVESFIMRGETIKKEEYHHVTDSGLIMPDYISGPKTDQWFNEISIFTSRTLINHPLHD